MSAKVEGTFTLDGLVEGRLGGQADECRARLESWLKTAQAAGAHFSLELGGDTFGVLGNGQPVPAAALGEDPAKRVAALLFDMLKVLPPSVRAQVFSTLRSSEYRRDEEIQTIYAVSPDGTVQLHQRTVAARTEAPPEPLTLRQKIRLGAVGVAVALAVFGISCFFVDYGKFLGQVKDTIIPVDPAAVKVDATAFARYFTAGKPAVVARGKVFALPVTRTKSFPLRDSDCDFQAYWGAMSNRLAVEALARGYVRFEWFGEDGALVDAGEIRIAALRQKDTIELRIPIPPERRPVCLRLGF